eukprot:g19785.t1
MCANKTEAPMPVPRLSAVFSSMPLKMMAFNPKQGYAARLPPPTLFWDGIVENMGAKMGLSVVDIVASSIISFF